jgi:hypothetical protein
LATFGHPNPFGILTTFDQTWICWVRPEDAGIAASVDRFQYESVANLVKGLPESDGKPPDQTTPPSAKASPPEQTSKEMEELKAVNRIVFVSQQVYKAHQLVPVICNAIFCGIQNIH